MSALDATLLLHSIYELGTYGGFLKLGSPKIDGLSWKIRVKGYPQFAKPPYVNTVHGNST